MTTRVRLRHRPVLGHCPPTPSFASQASLGSVACAMHNPRCDRSGRIERDVKAGHHAAIDVDGERERPQPDGQALLIVDHDDIEFRVIDSHEVERSLCAVEHARPRRKLIDRGLAVGPTTEASPSWNRRNPDPNRVCVGDTQLRFAAAARHFQRRRPDRPLLPRKEVLADGLFDDLLNLGIKAALAPAAAGFIRKQRREPPRRVRPGPPVERRGIQAGRSNSLDADRARGARPIQQRCDQIQTPASLAPVAIVDLAQIG